MSSEYRDPTQGGGRIRTLFFGRNLVLVVIALALLIPPSQTAFSVWQFGSDKWLSHAGNFSTTSVVVWYLYQGRRWARYLVLFLTGLSAFIMPSTIVASGYHPFFIAIMAAYVCIATLLAFGPGVKPFFDPTAREQLRRVEAMLLESCRPRPLGLAPPQFLEWAKQSGIHPVLISKFKSGWPLDKTDAGAMYLYSHEQIQDCTDGARCIASGLLVIGSCPNGDLLVVDFRDDIGSVGYISHEELWSDDEIDPRACYLLVSDNLEAFGEDSWGDDFPCDYYEAVERQEAK